MANKTASFISLKRSGFNRYDLSRWSFEGESVHLYFISGGEMKLSGSDARLFQNWVETKCQEAPGTYQPAMFRR